MRVPLCKSAETAESPRTMDKRILLHVCKMYRHKIGRIQKTMRFVEKYKKLKLCEAHLQGALPKVLTMSANDGSRRRFERSHRGNRKRYRNMDGDISRECDMDAGGTVSPSLLGVERKRSAEASFLCLDARALQFAGVSVQNLPVPCFSHVATVSAVMCLSDGSDFVSCAPLGACGSRLHASHSIWRRTVAVRRL